MASQSLSGRSTALAALHAGAVVPVADPDVSGKEQSARDRGLLPAVATVRGAAGLMAAAMGESTGGSETPGGGDPAMGGAVRNPGAAALAGATLATAGAGAALAGVTDEATPAQAAALRGLGAEGESVGHGEKLVTLGAGQALGAAAVGSDQGLRMLVCGPQRGGPLLPPGRAAAPRTAELATRLLQGEATDLSQSEDPGEHGQLEQEAKPEGMVSVAVARAAAAVATAIQTGAGPAGRSLGPAMHYVSLGRAVRMIARGQAGGARLALSEAVEAAMRQRDVVCAAIASGLRALMACSLGEQGWERGDSAASAALQQVLGAYTWRQLCALLAWSYSGSESVPRALPGAGSGVWPAAAAAAAVRGTLSSAVSQRMGRSAVGASGAGAVGDRGGGGGGGPLPVLGVAGGFLLGSSEGSLGGAARLSCSAPGVDRTRMALHAAVLCGASGHELLSRAGLHALARVTSGSEQSVAGTTLLFEAHARASIARGAPLLGDRPSLDPVASHSAHALGLTGEGPLPFDSARLMHASLGQRSVATLITPMTPQGTEGWELLRGRGGGPEGVSKRMRSVASGAAGAVAAGLGQLLRRHQVDELEASEARHRRRRLRAAGFGAVSRADEAAGAAWGCDGHGSVGSSRGLGGFSARDQLPPQWFGRGSGVSSGASASASASASAAASLVGDMVASAKSSGLLSARDAERLESIHYSSASVSAERHAVPVQEVPREQVDSDGFSFLETDTGGQAAMSSGTEPDFTVLLPPALPPATLQHSGAMAESESKSSDQTADAWGTDELAAGYGLLEASRALDAIGAAHNFLRNRCGGLPRSDAACLMTVPAVIDALGFGIETGRQGAADSATGSASAPLCTVGGAMAPARVAGLVLLARARLAAAISGKSSGG